MNKRERKIKDRKEAKKFVESLRPDEKKYWVIHTKERKPLDNSGIVYNNLGKRLLIFILKRYYPHKFNNFD